MDVVRIVGLECRVIAKGKEPNTYDMLVEGELSFLPDYITIISNDKHPLREGLQRISPTIERDRSEKPDGTAGTP